MSNSLPEDMKMSSEQVRKMDDASLYRHLKGVCGRQIVWFIFSQISFFALIFFAFELIISMLLVAFHLYDSLILPFPIGNATLFKSLTKKIAPSSRVGYVHLKKAFLLSGKIPS